MSIVGSEHGSLGGGDAFAALLSLVADKDAFEKRVAELKNAQEQVNAVLALVGPANEVLRIREETKKDREAAQKELADARQQAAQIIEDARSRAAAVVQEGKDTAEKIVADATRLRASAKEVSDAAHAKMQEAGQMMREAESVGVIASQVKKQAEQDIKNAQAVKDAYEQRAATLAAVAEQFRASLGGVSDA